MAVVAFILIIVIAVCLRQRRKHHTGDATLSKYQTDAGMEEIDLEVIENEGVCTKEEIKLQP